MPILNILDLKTESLVYSQMYIKHSNKEKIPYDPGKVDGDRYDIYLKFWWNNKYVEIFGYHDRLWREDYGVGFL